MTSRWRLVADAAALLRNAARRTPVDPTIEIVYTRAGSDFPIHGPLGPVSGRVHTPILRAGKPTAALVHDSVLARNPQRLRVAVEAASLVIDNELLKGALRTQLRDVQASRTRLVEAADSERRRVERNPHDGAQQRLVGLALILRLAVRQAAHDPAVTEFLMDALGELDDAIEELRRLARGVHPAIVSDAGLVAALESLAERPGLPVELSVEVPSRLPDAVEVAAYYLVAEALTNTNKHAQAHGVVVRAIVVGGELSVSVSDDGRGGAVAVPGSGLEGLADRISALRGRFVVDSPAGCGTTVSADIPLRPETSPATRPRNSLAAIRWMGWENWEVPAELYDQITEEDNLNFAKATLLCAGGSGCLTDREQDWFVGYRSAGGIPTVSLTRSGSTTTPMGSRTSPACRAWR